jgi:hypothetical protein
MCSVQLIDVTLFMIDGVMFDIHKKSFKNEEM